MADRSSSLVAAFRGPLLVAPLAVSLLATSLAALAQEPPSADEIVADLLAAGVHSHAFAELCQRDRDGALAALRSYLAAHHGERLAMDIRYAGRAVQECLGDGPAGEVAAHEFCAVLTRLGPEAATSWLDFIPNMCRKMPWGSAYRMRTATDDPELVPRLDLKLRATVPTVDELVSVEPATAVGYAARAGGWAMLAAAAREGRATCDIRQGRAAARDDIATALGMAPSSAPVLRLVARAETDLGAHLEAARHARAAVAAEQSAAEGAPLSATALAPVFVPGPAAGGPGGPLQDLWPRRPAWGVSSLSATRPLAPVWASAPPVLLAPVGARRIPPGPEQWIAPLSERVDVPLRGWREQHRAQWVVWPSDEYIAARQPPLARCDPLTPGGGLFRDAYAIRTPAEARWQAASRLTAMLTPECWPADAEACQVLLQEEDPRESWVACRFEAGGSGVQVVQRLWAVCLVVRPAPALVAGLAPDAIGPAVFRAVLRDGGGMADAETAEVAGLPEGIHGFILRGAEHSFGGFWYTDGKAVALFAESGVGYVAHPSGPADPWF